MHLLPQGDIEGRHLPIGKNPSSSGNNHQRKMHSTEVSPALVVVMSRQEIMHSIAYHKAGDHPAKPRKLM